MINLPNLSWLHWLQLTSPALPVGAYSYSEGIESLTASGAIAQGADLAAWLAAELAGGAVRVDAAVMARVWRATRAGDVAAVTRWNHWLTAAREAEELREQSLQMGRSLWRLLGELLTDGPAATDATWQRLDAVLNGGVRPECHFATAFGVAAAQWQVPESAAIGGYLYSWAANLVNAGIKLIPLGQTEGQKILQGSYGAIARETPAIAALEDNDLLAWSWGLSLASLSHETQYSRLFRS